MHIALAQQLIKENQKCAYSTTVLTPNEWKLGQLFDNIVNHYNKYKVSVQEQHIFNVEIKFFIIFKTLFLVIYKKRPSPKTEKSL